MVVGGGENGECVLCFCAHVICVLYVVRFLYCGFTFPLQSQRRRWPGGDSSQSASQGPAKRFHSDSSLEGEKFIV